MNNKIVRFKFSGDAGTVCVVDIDNVYVHTGDIESDSGADETKVVVIPF